MKVRVDPGRCQGHALCTLAAPSLFTLRDEEGHANAALPEVPDGMVLQAQDAVETCPEQAISLAD